MRRMILLTLPLALLLAALPAWTAGQGGPGDDGAAPAGISEGDENARGAFAGPVYLELRHAKRTFDARGIPITIARFMRVTAKIADGERVLLLHTDFSCSDLAWDPDLAQLPDPCVEITSCVIGNGNKEECVTEDVIDILSAGEISLIADALVARLIVSEFNLDPNTVLLVTKRKKYAQSRDLVPDVDGVLSALAAIELAFDSQ